MCHVKLIQTQFDVNGDKNIWMGAGKVEQNVQSGSKELNNNIVEWHKIAGIHAVRIQKCERERPDAKSDGMRLHLHL
jgi:hypothetical protein